jgi:hypothetical protein
MGYQKKVEAPVSVRFDIEQNSALNIQDVQSVTSQLISPSGLLITTFTTANPLDIVEISDTYFTTDGVYTIIGNIEHWDANNTLTNTTINIPYSVLLMVTD